MPEQLKNSLDDPTALLASGLAIGATTTTVTAGLGSRLPALGDFRLKLTDPDDDTIYELVKVGARASDTISSITRGIEGTTERAWLADTLVDLVQTVEGLALWDIEHLAAAGVRIANGSVAIDAGTYDPANYGGYYTKLIINAGTFIYDAGGDSAYTGSQSTIPLWSDWEVAPAVDGSAYHYSMYGGVYLTGSKTAGGITGFSADGQFYGTKAAGTGNQIDTVQGGYASAYGAGTGDVGHYEGFNVSAGHYGAGTVGDIKAVVGAARIASPAPVSDLYGAWFGAYVSIGSGPTISSLNALRVEASAGGRVVTTARGIYITNIGAHANVLTSYGLHIVAQVGSASAFSIFSEGGKSELWAGAAGTIPLAIKGHAGQTANLLEWRNSADTLLSQINSAGHYVGPRIVVSDFTVNGGGTFAGNITNSVGTLSSPHIFAGSGFISGYQMGAISDFASRVPLLVRGFTSQSANLQQWENVGGTVLASVTPTGALDMVEQADPAAPAANTGRFYVRDNGSSKSQLVVRFPSGAVQVIATEP